MELPYAVPANPPTAMPQRLEREMELLVGRLRDFSPARYAAPAPPFGTRAKALWHLAGYLVAAAGIDRQLPPLPDMALADVLAVTGHDLLTALGSDAPAAEPTAAESTAAAALAEVLLHRYEVDGSLPGRRATDAVLAVLEPTGGRTPGQLLRVARLRCPAYR